MASATSDPARNKADPTAKLHLFQVRFRKIGRLLDTGVDPIDPQSKYAAKLCNQLLTTYSSKNNVSFPVYQNWYLRDEKSGTLLMAGGLSLTPATLGVAALYELGKRAAGMNITWESVCFTSDGKPHPKRNSGSQDPKERVAIFDPPARPHCAIEYDGSSRVSRTFLPEESVEPLERWIYVFQARDEKGTDAKLVRELYFNDEFHPSNDPDRDRLRKGAYGELYQKGKIQQTDPSRWWKDADWQAHRAANPKADDVPRKLMPEPLKEVSLPVQTAEGKIARYFFFLARWQLPWDAIQAIKSVLPRRAVYLNDHFHSQVFQSGHEREVQDLLPNPAPGANSSKRTPADLDALYEKGELSYVVHLLDAFDEAGTRAADLDDALKGIAQVPPAENPDKYRLAREIEFFTEGVSELRQLVSKKLNEYLYRDGVEVFERKKLVSAASCMNLLKWIGRLQRRTDVQAYWGSYHSIEDLGETWFPGEEGDGKRPTRQFRLKTAVPPSAAPRIPPALNNADLGCPYAEGVHDYRNAPTAVRAQVVEFDTFVKARLPELPPGFDFLTQDVARFLSGDDPDRKQLRKTLGVGKEEFEKAKQHYSRAINIPSTSALEVLLATGKDWSKTGNRAWKMGIGETYARAFVRFMSGKEVVAQVDQLQKLHGIAVDLPGELRFGLEHERPAVAVHDAKGSHWVSPVEARRAALENAKESIKVENDSGPGVTEPQHSLDAVKGKVQKAGEAGAKALGFVAQAFSFYDAVNKLAKARDDYSAWLKAAQELAKFIQSGIETSATFKVMFHRSGTQWNWVTMKTGRWSGHVGAVIGVFLAADDMFKTGAEPPSDRAVYLASKSMKLATAAIGLAVAFSNPSGWAAVAIAVLTTLMDSIADWIGGNLKKKCLVLIYCSFGEQKPPKYAWSTTLAKQIEDLAVSSGLVGDELRRTHTKSFDEQRALLEQIIFELDPVFSLAASYEPNPGEQWPPPGTPNGAMAEPILKKTVATLELELKPYHWRVFVLPCRFKLLELDVWYLDYVFDPKKADFPIAQRVQVDRRQLCADLNWRMDKREEANGAVKVLRLPLAKVEQKVLVSGPHAMIDRQYFFVRLRAELHVEFMGEQRPPRNLVYDNALHVGTTPRGGHPVSCDCWPPLTEEDFAAGERQGPMQEGTDPIRWPKHAFGKTYYRPFFPKIT